jgi:hypothetical protein
MSGWAFLSHASSRSSRDLIELTFQVAIFVDMDSSSRSSSRCLEWAATGHGRYHVGHMAVNTPKEFHAAVGSVSGPVNLRIAEDKRNPLRTTESRL